MNTYWKTSVNELIEIFRGALSAVIPWLEKAKIKWREGEAYDDWDNIANALYENIICTSLISENISESLIAKYGFQYDNYSGIDFILVKANDTGENLAFISFQSVISPFDWVKVAILDNSYKVVNYLILEYKNLAFSFVKNKKGVKEITHEVTVII